MNLVDVYAGQLVRNTEHDHNINAEEAVPSLNQVPQKSDIHNAQNDVKSKLIEYALTLDLDAEIAKERVEKIIGDSKLFYMYVARSAQSPDVTISFKLIGFYKYIAQILLGNQDLNDIQSVFIGNQFVQIARKALSLEQ